jgi:hypothetical protein
MAEQVITIAKIPIKDIEEWIRTKHILPMVLSDFRLEGDNLVLTFHEEPPTEKQGDSPSPKTRTRRRRARKKRNRMKTRGWEVEARITNSKGQKCAIYKPFVDALKDQKMTAEEQKKVVEKILRSNRNRPDANSINYYLENTLEYLKGRS